MAVPSSVVSVAEGDISSDRFRPILTLPLLQFNMPHEFFDEVRGFRLAKLKDGAESESVALDMHEEGEFHVYAQTTFSTTASSHIPSSALARLAKLRDHAVTEIEQDISEES